MRTCRQSWKKKTVSPNNGSRLHTTHSPRAIGASRPRRSRGVPSPMSTTAPTPPRPVRDLPAIQKLVADGLQRGYLTREEMARALPSELGADRLEEVRAFIDESGIRIAASRRPAPRR